MFYGEHPPPLIKRRTAVLCNIVLSIDVGPSLDMWCCYRIEMGQNSSMGLFTGVPLKLLPLKKLFSMTSTILIGQWPNMLTFRGDDHASATPLDGSLQERPRHGPGNQIYLVANPATTIHQEHVPRIKIIPLLDNRYDAFDYDNHICKH